MASGDELRRMEEARTAAVAEARDLRTQQRSLLERVRTSLAEKEEAEAGRAQAEETNRKALDRLRLARAALQEGKRGDGTGAGLPDSGEEVFSDLEKRLKALLATPGRAATPSPPLGGPSPSPGGPPRGPAPQPGGTHVPTFVDAKELVKALREDQGSGFKQATPSFPKAPKLEASTVKATESKWPLVATYADYVRELDTFIRSSYPRGGGGDFSTTIATALKDLTSRRLRATDSDARAKVNAFEYNEYFTEPDARYCDGILVAIREAVPKWCRTEADFEQRRWCGEAIPATPLRMLAILWSAAKALGPKNPAELTKLQAELKELGSVFEGKAGRNWNTAIEKWILNARQTVAFSKAGFSTFELAQNTQKVFEQVHSKLNTTEAAGLLDFMRYNEDAKNLNGLEPTFENVETVLTKFANVCADSEEIAAIPGPKPKPKATATVAQVVDEQAHVAQTGDKGKGKGKKGKGKGKGKDGKDGEVPTPDGGKPKGKGKGKKGKGKGKDVSPGCFTCGALDHWKNECPQAPPCP